MRQYSGKRDVFIERRRRRFLFVLINQAKYYAQDTENQNSILGRLICLADCDKTSENESQRQLPESFNLYTCNPKLQECYIVS
jgi:hypothetical protein